MRTSLLQEKTMPKKNSNPTPRTAQGGPAPRALPKGITAKNINTILPTGWDPAGPAPSSSKAPSNKKYI